MTFNEQVDIKGMVERKKVEKGERGKIVEILIKWEAKISQFYREALWAET